MERIEMRIFLSLLLGWLVLGWLTAHRFLPQPDEAVYANAGYNLIHNGHFGTTLYELRGYMPASLAVHTFWQPPLYFYLTAVWYAVFDFGLLSTRSFSLLSGVLGLVSWFVVVSKLSGSKNAGFLAMGLVGLDYFYLLSASTGRMDMLCCGLGSAALASYLLLRERSPQRALAASHAFVTASILAHPTGGLYWVALVFLVWKLDRSSFRWTWVGYAAGPAVVGMILLGIHVWPDPQAFVEQMRHNAALSQEAFPTEGLSSMPLLRLLQLEIENRYVAAFGLRAGGMQQFKAVILAAYLAALVSGFFTRQGKAGILSGMTSIAMLYLAFVSPSKFYYYLAHVTCFLAAGLGLALYNLGQQAGKYRWLAAIALAGVGTIELTGNLYRVYQNPYDRFYRPAVQAAVTNSQQDSLIMASGDLWFGLENAGRSMIYDPYLGALSGRRPDLIVWAQTERQLQESNRTKNPALFQHVQQILDNSRLVYENSVYRVYLPITR